MSVKENNKDSHNRLAQEKSPYLLQHADNPVDWYPWAIDAFHKARTEDKPIFLSIGYSTCHWCHVMAHESFESPSVAAFLNENFVSIKVDREERPDIDGIYMSAVQAMTGQGGWPLSVFLTHDKKPFFGGTYFPPEARWGAPGFIDLLSSVHNAWMTDRDKILSSSQQFAKLLKERGELQSPTHGKMTEDLFTKAFQEFLSYYDERFGGFGHAPKFPSSHNLSFLLRYARRFKDEKAHSIVIHTLQKMADGGIYDHLGGGFHRYSTDQKWQVPHFEKMLYDQAMIAKAYLEAFQITKDNRFAQVIKETLDYVLRDMTSPEGAFYSAEDADSLEPQAEKSDEASGHEKKEGAFYVWGLDEINSILSPQEAEVFNFHFGIQPQGNAEVDPHGEFIGKNILAVSEDIRSTAQHFHLSQEAVVSLLKEAKQKFFAKRKQRPKPHLDDKILTDWNGLMISGFALASAILKDKRYLQAAQRAADFIMKNLANPQKRLLHRYRDGEASVLGNLEDYAFFIQALLDLYEASFDPLYIEKAFHLAEEMIELFWDEKAGGFYFTAKDAEELIFRQKEVYDGAIPSGNSIAALVMLRLYHLSFDAKWKTKAEEAFAVFSHLIEAQPSIYAQMLCAFDFFTGEVEEIVIAENKKGGYSLEAYQDVVFDLFIPNKILVLRPQEEKALHKTLIYSPYIKDQIPQQDQTTLYVCRNQVCSNPVFTPEDLRKTLQP